MAPWCAALGLTAENNSKHVTLFKIESQRWLKSHKAKRRAPQKGSKEKNSSIWLTSQTFLCEKLNFYATEIEKRLDQQPVN